MLKLPEDSRVGEEERSRQQGRIAFGFSRNTDSAASPVQEKQSLFFGETSLEQLEKLRDTGSQLSVQVAVLLKSLQSAVSEACDTTKANLDVYRGAVHELDQVVDANLHGATSLVECTMALSLELQGVDKIKTRIDALEKALSDFERTADIVIRKMR